MPQIIYDGECPFCSDYVAKLHLEATVGEVKLINARNQPELVKQLAKQGYELDKGMVFTHNDQTYFGADAIHQLALLSTNTSWFNRLNNWLFGIKWMAFFAYPLLRLGRNTTLMLLGRKPLTENHDQTAFFKLFTIVWAVFCLFHVFVYSTQFERASFITSIGIGFSALALLLKPGSKPLFIATIVISTVSAVSQMPVYSNHSLIKNFFLFASITLGIYHSVRGQSWTVFFQQLRYVGRALLLIMYFFGVLHKINTDFLNPEVSCAVVLWQQMPYFLSWLDYTFIHYLVIYGTLVGETLIAICLLVPRWRHIGIVSGMAFHALLGLSGYAMYPPFSTLCIALHCCFLSPRNAEQILQAPEWSKLWHWLKTVQGFSIAAALLVALFFTAWVRSYSAFGVVWLLLISPFLLVVARHGRVGRAVRLKADSFSYAIVATISLLFLFNGFMPYLGLKTAQSINMFANLRLEAGVSNHLIFSNTPGPWRYLDDVVLIQKSGGIAELEYARKNELGVIYYQLLNYLEQKPAATVDYIRAEKLYQGQSAATLQKDINDTLHPVWVRKLFHFNFVDFTTPKPCAWDR